MKWVFLCSLIVAFFGNLGGHDVPLVTHFQSGIETIDSNQGVSEKIVDADLPSFHKILEFFEKESDEDDRDHQYLEIQPSQTPSLLLFPKKTSSEFSFPPKTKVKLFILYLSWKSFLNS
jgi:hypothetical protein